MYEIDGTFQGLLSKFNDIEKLDETIKISNIILPTSQIIIDQFKQWTNFMVQYFFLGNFLFVCWENTHP